ncbi:MAG TPA: pyridoxamine 5'-phosphate oxidase [Thermoanaerobaculia bacterium]|nr:pyridoxamine 5'-phosphate oxidase [Thermoanaerobaculia bacterium]
MSGERDERLAASVAEHPAGDDPLADFETLFERARREVAAPQDATACVLATADADGRPSARVVLLKGVDERGFQFFTNYGSRKAVQLAANPQAALCFHWPALGVQVRAEGEAERLPEAESDAYFASRPRGSRVGAWASRQSRPLTSRAELLERVAEAEARFAGEAVERPGFWGGYLLRPRRIEIWWDGEFRLHDRLVYTRRTDGGWNAERQYP